MHTGLDWGRHFPQPTSKCSSSGGHLYSVVLVKYRCARSYPDPTHCTMISPFKRKSSNSGQDYLRGKEQLSFKPEEVMGKAISEIRETIQTPSLIFLLLLVVSTSLNSILVTHKTLQKTSFLRHSLYCPKLVSSKDTFKKFTINVHIQGSGVRCTLFWLDDRSMLANRTMRKCLQYRLLIGQNRESTSYFQYFFKWYVHVYV